jgi:GTP-binding protein
LTPPRIMSLDECIEYISEDEFLEVTPKSLRIRKKILGTEERRKTTSREGRETE